MESYYHCLDIFVLPAKIEEFGLVASEAMACGTAVILSPYVGASELADKDSVLESLDATSLKLAILNFINNHERRDKSIRKNLENIKESEEKKIYEHYTKVFKEYLH